MEKNFYPENFEKFLRGHADQFKMSPSKKVWRGIYNDLHPGRRWPSIAMSMVFIFVLVIIGHLNTNNGGNTPLYDLTSNNQKPVSENNLASVKHPEPNSIKVSDNLTPEYKSGNISPNGAVVDIQTSTKYDNPILENKREHLTSQKFENKVIKPNNNPDVVTNSTADLIKDNSLSIQSSNRKNEVKTSGNETSNIPAESNEVNIKPKKINNVTWQYYVSPSVSYRYLSNNNIDNAVIHKPMIGYEAGTEMNFKIDKNLQFTTGLQLNYSGYNIKANNTHPTIATLMLNTDIPGQSVAYSAMSHYGNRSGAELTRLKNYSLQASIPIGLQYMLAEKENIRFGAAAAFQPSFIIANNTYLLSTDKRNYMKDPDLFRKWNMNTNLTTFVAFSSNSLNWQIGPQVRYQLLSTYSKRYPVKEHLVNYGIRIGISKIPK